MLLFIKVIIINIFNNNFVSKFIYLKNIINNNFSDKFYILK